RRASRSSTSPRARGSPAFSASWTATTTMAKTAATARTATRTARTPRKAATTRKKTARAATPPHIRPAARIFNFGAGPATMPAEVLEKAKWELLNWHDAGMSVMEMSHRGKEFVAIAARAEADLRKLLAIPAN